LSKPQWRLSSAENRFCIGEGRQLLVACAKNCVAKFLIGRTIVVRVPGGRRINRSNIIPVVTTVRSPSSRRRMQRRRISAASRRARTRSKRRGGRTLLEIFMYA
jgi:hypothetical protein